MIKIYLFQSVFTNFRSFLKRIELDKVVLFSILSRIWALVAGPVTVCLIAIKFSPTVQGFYYTFGPILGLQTFVELGIGFAIAQFASHEWATLSLDKNRMITGDADSLSRLSSLTKFSIKWYSVGTSIVIIGSIIIGYIFFSKSPDHSVNWKLPWISLCILAGLNFIFVPFWSLLEGCNQVLDVYRYRFFQNVITSLSIWCAIMFGAGLWTASIMTLAGIIYAAIFLYFKYNNFFKMLLFNKLKGPRLSWTADILPLQWRVALGWMVGYFLTSLFVPVLFYYHGPVIAGRMGMTWALVAALQSICGAWIFPKVPQFAIWAKEGKYEEMDRMFYKQFKIMFMLSTLGGISLWTIILILSKSNHYLSARLLSPLPTAILFFTGILHAITLPMSLYLIAHKKMPFLSASIAAGLISGVGTLILGKLFSALGVSISYMLAYLVAFPLTAYIWQHCRRKWHKI